MYTLRKLPGEPIILVTFIEPFIWHSEIPEVAKELIGMLESQTKPVYVICDFANAAASISDIAFTADFVLRMGNRILGHPNVIELLPVQASGLMEMAGTDMSLDMYDNVPPEVMETIEQALRFLRENIKGGDWPDIPPSADNDDPGEN
jgi:hypothetical protein